MVKVNGYIQKREIVITIAIACKLSYEETQKLLRNNNEPELYARDRRDSILIWAIYHGQNIKEVNAICKKYNCDSVKELEEIEELIKNRRYENERMKITDVWKRL